MNSGMNSSESYLYFSHYLSNNMGLTWLLILLEADLLLHIIKVPLGNNTTLI